MGLANYLVFGALAGLTALRAARSTGRGELAVWAAATFGFALVAAVAALRGASEFSDFVFYFVALLSVISALRVVTQDNPVHSAIWLILVFLCMAVLFVLLRAEFLAAVQIIIYAGAIMVLYVFIIMFVDIDAARGQPAPAWILACALGTAAAFLLLIAPVALGLGAHAAPAAGASGYGSVERMGEAIYFGATLPFEAVSLILLVALVGAVVIGKAE
jgi:NADH-quinone oxidoreductase subunit J